MLNDIQVSYSQINSYGIGVLYGESFFLHQGFRATVTSGLQPLTLVIQDLFFISTAKFRECPAYTLLCQFSPKDTGQSKVKQSHKIDEVTTVASAQAPKSLQPGKCPFHYPAAGWIPPAFTDFFPPAADMLLKSVNIDFLADSWIIIPLVQTEVPNFSPQKPAAHFPRVFQGCSYQAAVMHIGACDRHSQRNTLTVHMEMNLAATSPSVRRVASKPLSRCFFVSASALAARCRP